MRELAEGDVSPALGAFSLLEYCLSSIHDLVPFYQRVLTNPHSEVRRFAVSMLTIRGKKLLMQDVKRLEAELDTDPRNVASRALLLGYYFSNTATHTLALERRHKHIIWTIANVADSEIAAVPEIGLGATDGDVYSEAKRLWLQQIRDKPENTTMLWNAAAFFYGEETPLAESLLRKGQALEPQDPRWCQKLGQLYLLGLDRLSGEARKEAGAKSLAELEKALSATEDEVSRGYILTNAARAAMEADERDKGRSYALELLERGHMEDSCDDVLYTHKACLILGRIALREGNVEEAKKCLLEATEVKGESLQGSFDPYMKLAQELLLRGEREAVLEYLRRCAAKWITTNHRLERWIYSLEHGETPDFGANLVY
jgi:tetratricopeptide (TPR) repeat protein